jgi:type II secretory pathway pseudopilin PulG
MSTLPVPPISGGSFRRRIAFTLVEMLVVIGIITLILSIALPVTFTARRKASRMKAVRDVAALSIALDEFKNNNNEYPRVYYPYLTTAGTTLATDPRNSKNGQQALYCALTGLDMKGNPITNPKSGRPVQGMINVENFRVQLGSISDTNNKPYLYFVAAVPMPDITTIQGGRGMFVDDNPARTAPFPLYNHSDCAAISLKHMRVLLGDDKNGTPSNPNGNGHIDINLGEKAASVAPYLLWGAGPDGAYGLDTQPKPKTDDVTNFELPLQYIR